MFSSRKFIFSSRPSANSANYNRGAIWNGINWVTTVGSNGRSSAYGTFDQSGNVFEWIDLEGAIAEPEKSLEWGLIRGGDWLNNALNLSSSIRGVFPYSFFSTATGFHIASYSNPLNLDLVTIGDINNASDVDLTTVGRDGFGTRYGSVDRVYQIGKYPVTNCEYAEFLNAIATVDRYDIYASGMGTGLIDIVGDLAGAYSSIFRGIDPSDPTRFVYYVKENMKNKPVTLITWFNAARYCNWLHNGRPSGDQNNSTTEDGVYALGGRTTGNAVTKKSNANYHIPTENEWYKAAYYKGGGTNAGYWAYATQSDTVPTAVLASSTGDGLINGGPASIPDYVCNSVPKQTVPENLKTIFMRIE
jgi:formylglycine-generating enzyme required for sulfatase activity